MSGNLARAHEASLAAIALTMAEPLLDQLGPMWILESEAFEGLNYPNMRAFWACELGLAERRRRGFFPRRWWIRLTKKGWENE